MAEVLWTIRFVLTNGETRHLAGSATVEEATARFIDIQQRRGDYAADWLDTQDSTVIARAHIVEMSIVPQPD